MLQQEGYRQIKFHQLLALKLCSLPPEVNHVPLNFHKEGKGQMQKTSKKKLKSNIYTNKSIAAAVIPLTAVYTLMPLRFVSLVSALPD